MKSRAQLPSVKKQSALNKLRRHHLKMQHERDMARDKLCPLEKLPVELIQQIFFYALEVNLPRASLHLQQVLSNEAIFDALIVFAYFDDDGINPVEKKHFLPAQYRLLSLEEKVRLQQSIFTCRWCTYARIESCLPALTRAAIVQAWHAEHAQDESCGINDALSSPLIVANGSTRELAPLPGLDEHEKLDEHFLAHISLRELGSSESRRWPNSTRCPRIVTWSSALDEHAVVHKSTDRTVSVFAARHIPSWLLRRTPWTADQVSLLQLLRQGYTFIENDHVMSISAPAVFEGMRNAIREGHLIALKTLLDMHNVFFRSGAVTFYSMMNTQYTPLSQHPLPLDLFHLAVRQHNKATDVLLLLLRAGIDSVSKDDNIITSWAVHESRLQNELATWLLQHMEGTNYGLPRRAHLFVDGALSWRARVTFRFPETTFATELGYIAGRPIVPAGLNDSICGNEGG